MKAVRVIWEDGSASMTQCRDDNYMNGFIDGFKEACYHLPIQYRPQQIDILDSETEGNVGNKATEGVQGN
jgi:hypothetical protein